MPRFLLALLSSIALGVQGQSSHPVDPARLAVTQYRIDAWQSEQGLPLNTVQAVYQSRDGYLWVGTGGGLARFDGTRFSTFENTPGFELESRPVFGFYEATDGSLWIGHSLGASRYRKGRFERVVGNELMEGRRVWAFAEDRHGVIWGATENGLLRWENGTGRLLKEADGLPTRRLRSVAFDRDGALWIGTSGGGLIRHVKGRFEVFDPQRGFPHTEVRHVLADPAGGVWAATAGAGLVRVEGETIRAFGAADGLPTEQLTYLARDAAGALWIGTWGSGLVRMSGGKFETLSSAGGLAGDQIWSVHADREGSVWVGTWHGGMNRLSARSFLVFGKPEGLAGDNTRAVIHGRNAATWVASAGGGVSRIAHGQVTVFGRKDGLPTEETSTLLEDREGAIWIGTYTGGVARMFEGRIDRFGVAHGLPSVDVRALYQDRAGTIWAGTVAGIARFDGRRFVAVREGGPREGVAAIVETRDGALWLGSTSEGLFRYRDGQFTVFTRKDGLASNAIVSLHEDGAGSLWIGTNGAGISRYRDGRIGSVTTSDGLWDGLAQVILEDRAGNFWMTCNRGFFRVARSELEQFLDGRATRVSSTAFGPGDGLRVATFAGGVQPAGAIDAKGHLWLPSLKGLVIVDPERLPGQGQAPPVFIEEVTINGAILPPEGEVVLPPGSDPLQIRYAAGTLRNADRVRFRYRMDGVSPNWIEVGRNREVTFPTLSHGRYRFHLGASIDGRTWREAETPLAIHVRPRFYETYGFMALLALAATGAAVGFFRLRTHQLRRRHAEMERLVAQKTEELRIANEHLSRLSFADALTGLANRRRLDEALDTEWRRGLRMGTPLAIIIADVDAFKEYNDTLGHPEGDRCLVAVAEAIRATASRAGDFVARYGGEEFVVVVPGADLASATALAENLRRAVELKALPHPSSIVAPVVTVSVGVAACVPDDEASAAALLAQADAGLYRAKQEGRNRVRTAPHAGVAQSPMASKVLRR